MLQTNFDSFPILTTERLVLRPLKITDAEEILLQGGGREIGLL